MSERSSLYLVGDETVLDSYSSLMIDDKDFTRKATKAIIRRIALTSEYTVLAYNGPEVVWVLSDDRIFDKGFYEKSSLNGLPNYHLLTKKTMWTNHFVSQLALAKVECPVCGKSVFPEPEQYCTHVAFVYAYDNEGLLAHWNPSIIGSYEDRLNLSLLFEETIENICAAQDVSLHRYIQKEESFYGRPALFIGFCLDDTI